MDLRLITDKGDLSSYMNNSEFDLLDMTARKEIIKFPTDPMYEWPVIIIRIRMHRRPLFYVFNHILPCVLISSMAVLGFFMPPQTGEKINMCITTILSMGVYLQSITESIPPTSEAVPLIGMYYVASLFMVCLATSINVITLNIYRNSVANQGERVPRWMQKYILGYLASFMRMPIYQPDSIALLKTSQSKKSTISRNSIFKELGVLRRYKRSSANLASECECLKRPLLGHSRDTEMLLKDADVKQGAGPVHIDYKLKNSLPMEKLLPRLTSARSPMLDEFEERFRIILKRIYRSLQQHEIREEVIDERRRIQWQWQQIATVVDRLLLVLFSIVTLSTVVFFLVLPVTFQDANSQSAFIL